MKPKWWKLRREQTSDCFGQKCIKVLEQFGFAIYRQRGSHVTLVRENLPNQTTVPLHRELDRGTLRAILRQTNISVEEFVAKL